jgi:allantoinase
MRTAVVGGTIVTSWGRVLADVVLEDGKVAALVEPGRAGPSDEKVDARGKLVFSGFIDPHVHSRDPGLTEKEDFAHSTRAALCGGITTLLEMPNAVPPVSDAHVYHDRVAQHTEVASTDFGLWGISLGAANLGDLRGLVEAGVVGIKLFWGYALDRITRELVYNLADRRPEDVIPPPSNAEVWDLFREVAAAGGLLAAHCEDRGVLEAAQRGLGHELRSYADLLAARPDAAEAAAIATAVELSRATGCRFHVVHVSSGRGVELVRRARADGVSFSAETCPHYLTLSEEDFDRVGPMMKVYPPVRTARDREDLRAAVRDGTISSIGSDHAPHTIAQKRQGLATSPAGFVGVETLVPLLLNEAASGRVSWERLAWVLSEGTARVYRLYPRKGALLPGSDADLAVVDPEAEWEVDDARLHSKHSLSPWHGRRGRGRVVRALLRGETVMRDGEPVGEPRGRHVRPLREGPGVRT